MAVGIRLAPPFVSEDSIRGLRGLAVDLWRSIEQDLQAQGLMVSSEFVECDLRQQLVALAEGRLDVVISPLTITAERLANIDFSQQYLSSGLTVAVPQGSAIDFGHALRILGQTITQPGVPRAILIFLLLNMFFAFLFSRALRDHRHAGDIMTEPRVMRGYRYMMESIIRTTGLYTMSVDFKSTLGRSLDMIMAILGAVLSAAIFGVLTAALIGSIGASRDITLEQLSELRVATLHGSTAQHFIEEMSTASAAWQQSRYFNPQADAGPTYAFHRRAALLDNNDDAMADILGAVADLPTVRCQPAELATTDSTCLLLPTWDEAMQRLARGEVDVVLGDWAQLTYLARLPAYHGRIEVQSEVYRNEPYGWGINPARPELRHAIDRALLQRLRSPEWRYLVQEYMGSGSIAPD
ncbi:transporter substrate-binding domain-containing protein [Halopseudomonas salegens]|uniref:transporter substrate-binding domain-containing protein n=1 Tax=Halopseudomonas salegens TaxID=1434072 RepID=UPI0012FD94DD|nr:transporter substrate-binding domain-containing protein [Halopseudomonas salegens]